MSVRVFGSKGLCFLTGMGMASILVSSSIVQAETLKQAMLFAYNNSPQIALEREKLKLADESIISAEAGLFPTLNGEVSASGNWGRTFIKGRRSSTGKLSEVSTSEQLGVTGSLSAGYTLWDNGITKNRISQAEIGRQLQDDMFKNAEQNFLISIFTVYVDLLRDSATLNVQMKNFNVLSEQVKSTEALFQVGENTATDVALAKARKTAATSAIAGAKAQMDFSRATYEQLVGHKPKNIAHPKQVANLLPRSLQSAINYAETHHPAIQSLKKQVLVAEKSVQIADAGLMPSAQAFGNASHNISFDGKAAQSNLTLGARLSIPIFNGGIKHSQTRQERIKLAQARLNLTISRAQVVAGVKARWSALKAARVSLTAQNAQIRASKAVLNGIKAEKNEGVRTSFDVLNSEKDLLSAKLQSIIYKRSILLSEMQLLSSIGKLTIHNLGL